ncbi:MAG: transposase [Candidatus Binatia bacterium]|nr:transposase [Candidatus Binatia bacterium]
MPRVGRGDQPGGIYHLYPRGVNRQRIFVDDRDRFYFLKCLVRACRLGDLRVVAYVLMSNHVHIVALRGSLKLGIALKSLLGRYAQHFNRRHQRCGHLFQQRYGSKLCDTDDYLVHLIRYVHANPVRAEMVAAAGEYRHSSHRWYADSRWPRWAAPEVVQGSFGSSTALRRFFAKSDVLQDRRQIEAYESRVLGARLVPVEPGGALPGEPSLEALAPEPRQLVALQAEIERYRGLSPGQLYGNRPTETAAAARREFAVAAVKLGGVRAASVARFLGISPGRVSQVLSAWRDD